MNDLQIRAVKGLLFALCLLPLVYYVRAFQQDALGNDPVDAVTRGFGLWALRFLLITLAVTPLRRLAGQHWLGRVRRMLGLFAFLYGCLHLTAYIWLDQSFVWREIANDILERPLIVAGMLAFALMVPLALTSSNAMIRRLGGRRWQELHRTIYAISLIAVIHYGWMAESGKGGPLLYAAIALALLGLRFWWREQERRRQLAGAYAKPKGKIIPINPRR